MRTKCRFAGLALALSLAFPVGVATAPAAEAATIPTYTHTSSNIGDFNSVTKYLAYYHIRVRVSGKILGKAALYLDGRLQRVRQLRDGVIVFRVKRSELRDNHTTTVTVTVFPKRDARQDRVIRRHVRDTTAGQRALELAKRQVGDAYSHGAMGPSSFDCSGLVQYAYRHATGKRLPHGSRAILKAGKRVSKPELGDILYTPGHVSIYAGHGRVVEAANPRSDVIYRAIWQRNPVFIRL